MKTLNSQELSTVMGGGDDGASFAHDIGRALGFLYTTVVYFRMDAPSTSFALAAGTAAGTGSE